jgi:septal ring factor EnvC (AmiA/AmiB activator)
VATRDDYIEKLKTQLDEWNDEIGKLEARLAERNEATRKKLEPHLAKAREARDTVRAKLKELRDSGEKSWDSARDEVEHVVKVFKQSVKYFRSQL